MDSPLEQADSNSGSHPRATPPVATRFVADSALEERRFELSVPPRNGHSRTGFFDFLACGSAGSEGAQLPGRTRDFGSAHPLPCLSCRARRTGSARAGCQSVDGHSELPVDCLAELMCQTRAGESGSWFGIAPNEAKALATALAIRPPIGMIAPSPAPLTPSGLLGDRWFSSAIARILGKSVAVGIR